MLEPQLPIVKSVSVRKAIYIQFVQDLDDNMTRYQITAIGF